jgi:hypothetical protein
MGRKFTQKRYRDSHEPVGIGVGSSVGFRVGRVLGCGVVPTPLLTEVLLPLSKADAEMVTSTRGVGIGVGGGVFGAKEG